MEERSLAISHRLISHDKWFVSVLYGIDHPNGGDHTWLASYETMVEAHKIELPWLSPKRDNAEFQSWSNKRLLECLTF